MSLPFHHPRAPLMSYLLGLSLVLGRVVFAGLLAGGCDGPLALLELLGLGSLGRHGGHCARQLVSNRRMGRGRAGVRCVRTRKDGAVWVSRG